MLCFAHLGGISCRGADVKALAICGLADGSLLVVVTTRLRQRPFVPALLVEDRPPLIAELLEAQDVGPNPRRLGAINTKLALMPGHCSTLALSSSS